MPKEFWPLAEAKKVLESRQWKQDETIVFETGFGPSGLPHIGTFAEVVRTSFVIAALKHLEPNRKIKLITFSDDMDGLRKLPSNIPNHEKLKPYLGRPLRDIPDPFEECDSYSGYMNNKLKEFLDSFGFEYSFKSAAESYRSGEFDPGLDKIFDHYEKIREIFIKTISEEKRAAWSPFFMLCSNCKKINTTSVSKIDRDKRLIHYKCDTDTEEYSSCGYEGVEDFRGGKSKVGWKVDWALRWYLLDIAYEMHGEDLLDSVKVSAKISRLLGGKAPVNFKYELFLDEKNRKISKKEGNGISMEQWMRYSPLAALLNFLLANPNKSKKMGLPILPQIIDEFFRQLGSGDLNSPESPSWYIAKFPAAALPSKAPKITYTLLTNVCESLSLKDKSVLYAYAKKYDPAIEEDREFYLDLCQKVIFYVSEYKSLNKDMPEEPDESFLPLLKELRLLLESLSEDSPEFEADALQTAIFSIAKNHERQPADWFKFLYVIMLNQNKGPKLGPMISMLGKEKSLEFLKIPEKNQSQ